MVNPFGAEIITIHLRTTPLPYVTFPVTFNISRSTISGVPLKAS